MMGWMRNAHLHDAPRPGERVEMTYPGGLHICKDLRDAVDTWLRYVVSCGIEPVCNLRATVWRGAHAWVTLMPDGKVLRCGSGHEVNPDTQKDWTHEPLQRD
jgi:hypothetical protein